MGDRWRRRAVSGRERKSKWRERKSKWREETGLEKAEISSPVSSTFIQN